MARVTKHLCHWPTCGTAVPPKMWGCPKHWFRLPKHLRELIWATYVPGQEVRLDPSDDYLAVAQEVDDWCHAWIAEHGEAA